MADVAIDPLLGSPVTRAPAKSQKLPEGSKQTLATPTKEEGQESEAVREQVMAVVRANFRPEFLNRLDETLLFHRLERKHMAGIVDIQLGRLRAMLADRKITLELDDSARDWLAATGYDPVYGARPLKRVIQRSLQNPLATLLLEGSIRDGETVTVMAGEAGLMINGQQAKAA